MAMAHVLSQDQATPAAGSDEQRRLMASVHINR
jgi:hypothetical protein